MTGSKSWDCNKIIKELNILNEAEEFSYSRVDKEDVWKILNYHESWKDVFSQLSDIADELSIISDDIEHIRGKSASAVNQLILRDFSYFSGKVLEQKKVSSDTFIRLLMENFQHESDEDSHHHIKHSESESTSSSQFSSCSSTPVGSFERDSSITPPASPKKFDQPQQPENINKIMEQENENPKEYSPKLDDPVPKEEPVKQSQASPEVPKVGPVSPTLQDEEDTAIDEKFTQREISNHRMPKSLAPIKLRDKRPVWTKDDEYPHCMICKATFTLFRRRVSFPFIFLSRSELMLVKASLQKLWQTV